LHESKFKDSKLINSRSNKAAQGFNFTILKFYSTVVF